MSKPFEQKWLYDFLDAFPDGMNQGIAPSLLPRTQLAKAINCTVRGAYLDQRPAFKKRTLIFMDEGWEEDFTTGLWQGACTFKADNQQESLMCSISGKLFQIEVIADQFTVYQRSTASTQQLDSAPRCWLWQSELYVIWNDGISNPVFFNGNTNTCTRSNYSQPLLYNTTITADFVIPAVGAEETVAFTSVANLLVGDLVTFNTGAAPLSKYGGTMKVQSITGLNVVLANINMQIPGGTIFSGRPVQWIHLGVQLPPGRMGAYGMGRNWVCLVDGKQFIGGDQVGGSSGTQALQYRDAVLNITENIYLAGGGNFTVPGSVGDIQAMKFCATLDASLGQGPLQVLTNTTIFSVNTPVDRATWQDITNPILTETLLSNGGTSQNSTIINNSDVLFRSLIGLGSEILARREFGTWGNTPISNEVRNILAADNQSLLGFSSATVFQNRAIFTTGPTQHGQGVYHKGFVVINNDPISSLRGKAPSVYDGQWIGINTLQIVSDKFRGTERCFAFTLNTVESKIELYEVLKDEEEFYDNGNQRISRSFESPVIFNKDVNRQRELLQLHDGEIYVDELRGTVTFQVFWRPDSFPCWQPWFTWSECAKEPVANDPNTYTYKPQFRPQMGLGEPRADLCDEVTKRPFRQGNSFQIKIVWTGPGQFLGGKFEAFTVPQRIFAKQQCATVCR